MENVKKQPSLVIPNGWAEVFARTAITAVVAFLVLQSKEWFDTGIFDTPGTAADAGLIAAGILLLNVILKLVKS